MSDALERGLKLLSLVNEKDIPLSFGELNSRLGDLNRASLSRLLSRLIELGYLYKDPRSGLYSPGYRMGQFSGRREGEEEIRSYLIGRFSPGLDDFCRKYNLTGIILQERGDMLVNIHRIMTEYSPWMQEEDRANDDPREPWLQVFAAYSPRLEKQIAHLPGVAEKIAAIRVKGYELDNFERREAFRRLAFPLMDGEKRCRGILGLGGYRENLTDEAVESSLKAFRPGKLPWRP